METKCYEFSGQKVVTKGIDLTIPLHLQLIMWKTIYDLEVPRDYLQVFQLTAQGGAQKLVHKQTNLACTVFESGCFLW